MDTVLTALLTFLGSIFVFLIWRRHQTLQHFKRLGIPGPPPNFFTGSLLEYIRKGPVKCQTDWLNKYGPTAGVFLGIKPVIFTCDSELIKLAWIKDFKRFANREFIVGALGGSVGKNINESVGNLIGQEWKETRSILSPSFSTAKMRQMPSNIKSGIDVFVEKCLSAKKIDLVKACKALCLDAILRSSMSLNNTVQKEDKNPILLGLTYGLNHFYMEFPYILALCFPPSIYLLLIYWNLKERIRNFLRLPSGEVVEEIAIDVLEQRRKMKDTTRKDMIQLMIDTQKMNDKERGSSKILKDSEIVANIVDFMVGGLESMGTGLAMAIYHLTMNQKLQDECRKEVIEGLGTGKEIDYDKMISLKLIENAAKESQRLYASGNIILIRTAEEDVKYKQFHFPKGTNIISASMKMHYDPDIWENPTSFDPHRFSSDKDITAYQSFGLGPRGCIANRYSILVLKTILADVLRQVKFTPLPETIKEPEIEYGIFNPRVNNLIVVSCNPITK